MKFGIQEFLGSLITNLRSTFRNSKWRMCNSRSKYKKLLDCDKICFSGIFGIKKFLLLPVGVQICWELSLSFWINYLEFLCFDSRFHPNQVDFLDFAPPYSIFRNVDFRFVISDPKNLPVHNCIPIK